MSLEERYGYAPRPNPDRTTFPMYHLYDFWDRTIYRPLLGGEVEPLVEAGTLIRARFEGIATRLRVWLRRAVNNVIRPRRVFDAVMHGANTGGRNDRQILLRRLQFVA